MTDATDTTTDPTHAPKLSPLDLARATPELFAALARAQSAARTVGKDGKHDQKGYTYATAEAMIRAFRAAIDGTGLSLISTWEWRDVEPIEVGKQWITGIVVEHWIIAHESGGYVRGASECHVVESAGRPRDKATAAALTYMHGFVLRQILNLDRDDEGAAAVDRRPDMEGDTAPNYGRRGGSDRRPDRRHPEPPRAAEVRVVRSEPAARPAARPAATPPGDDYAAKRRELGDELNAFLEECERQTGVRREWSDVLSEALGEPWPEPPKRPTVKQMEAAIPELHRARLALKHGPEQYETADDDDLAAALGVGEGDDQ